MSAILILIHPDHEPLLEENEALKSLCANLEQRLAEQGSNIAELRSAAELVGQLQELLEERDRENDELRHALAVARLSPESRARVIQLIRESAA
ncbi:hypothetical protein [Chromobacterium paludis]|uniref:Uncharacterized protein n=1 Tax=Chromobacterium paludis TaxID=2605945 RepID=A0A5C1DHP3_9NEIS|nr:hypothetical protein [Chromobacterium paludis]QEL55469.1 hypothetical protein FYK34_07780 [Chromobacterium paludis]